MVNLLRRGNRELKFMKKSKICCSGLLKLKIILGCLLLPAMGLQSAEFNELGQLRINNVPGKVSVDSERMTVKSNLADVVRQNFTVKFNSRVVPLQVTGSKTTVQAKGRHPYTLYFERYSDLGREYAVESAVEIPADLKIKQYEFKYGGADLLLEHGEKNFSRFRVLNSSENPLGVQNGGPAMIERTAYNSPEFGIGKLPHLVFPNYTRKPSFSYLQLANEKDVFKSKWVNEGRNLYIEWNDQIDKYTIDVDEKGQLNFVFERECGENSNQIISFGLEPEEKAPARDGKLIGYWSFDELQGNTCKDLSGRNNTAVVSGGIQPIAGMKGQAIYGLRCSGVPLGETIATDADNKVPGELKFGKVTLPKEVLDPITDAMTISFWYNQPEFTSKGFGGYIGQQQQQHGGEKQLPFAANGFLSLYNMWHFLGGQRITAAGLGNHRLFGMYGPLQQRGIWSFYTIVIDKNIARMYINGELKMETEGKISLADAKRSFEEILVMQNMWGTMDELKIYDYPLDVNQMKHEFMSSQAQEMTFLDFEKGLVSRGKNQVVKDARNNSHICENAEIVPSKNGKGLRFGPKGGKLTMPHAINSGKKLGVLTFSAWIKVPEGFKDRVNIFNTQTGHSGFEINAWTDNLWGKASQNVFGGKLGTGKWVHLIVSYGYNRLTIWIDGQVSSDNKEVYPCSKGWDVQSRPYILSFDRPLELDEVRLLNFFPDENNVQALYKGKPVEIPKVEFSENIKKEIIKAQKIR